MQDDCLDVSNKPFYKRQKKVIPATVALLLGPNVFSQHHNQNIKIVINSINA